MALFVTMMTFVPLKYVTFSAEKRFNKDKAGHTLDISPGLT